MVEELNCEELEREKNHIIQLLCSSLHPLPKYAFVTVDISRTQVEKALKCLFHEGILCKTEWEYQAAYDLCDRKKTCVGTSNVSDAQDIADAQGGTAV